MTDHQAPSTSERLTVHAVWCSGCPALCTTINIHPVMRDLQAALERARAVVEAVRADHPDYRDSGCQAMCRLCTALAQYGQGQAERAST